ncbi:MAG TPA: hypothetical protein DCY51_03540 [Bacteroidetes bacterium]|nr:hypothetical protein [Bacteroidota bacterium]
MSEHDLRELGFEVVHIHDFDLGEEPFYYYVWRIGEDLHGYLISCTDDEVENGKWVVYETNSDYVVKFTKIDDLRNYIGIIKRNLVL